MKKQLSPESVENLVVLLIDMQNGFIDDLEKRNLIPNQISVLRMCQAKGIPVIMIEFSGHGNTDTALLEAINNIPLDNIKKVIKNHNNAFTETSLENLLKEFNAKALLIMGINACACVYETAVDAHERGYEIITSEKLIAGYCSSCQNGPRREWYKNNTVYADDHNHLFQDLGFCETAVS